MMINIEVAYAKEDQQITIPVQVPENTTVLQAIILSKIIEIFPEINLEKNKIGIFSEYVSQNDLVHEGDRIEIYRSLKIDPKAARRKR